MSMPYGISIVPPIPSSQPIGLSPRSKAVLISSISSLQSGVMVPMIVNIKFFNLFLLSMVHPLKPALIAGFYYSCFFYFKHDFTYTIQFYFYDYGILLFFF